MSNMFENHELIVEIYEILRDHNVLTDESPLSSLGTVERKFLEEIDKSITVAIETEVQRNINP